jgi:predicted Rossmann fold nucleotide-binding protein DprA/Smf involved in DNA uptake
LTDKQADLFGDKVSIGLDPKAIAVTGSRSIPREIGRTLFDRFLVPWLGDGRTWFTGGARGLDLWCLEWLLDRAETCHVVVPFSVQDQPQPTRPVIERASHVTELGYPKSKHAYLKRNEYMVERAGVVIGFRSGDSKGTLNTLQYAIRSGREVHAYPTETYEEG